VTTRIRGLLKNSAEVDVGILSKEEGLKLLLSSADVMDVDEASDEYRIAGEIVELCGRLPLTLAIAGGMVADNPDGFTDEVVELMKEDRLREQDDEDDSGVTLEERVCFPLFSFPSTPLPFHISLPSLDLAWLVRFTGHQQLAEND
jgi:hypothetical protein